ncbi:MAG: hypothetical protein M2R45_04603 [Verrucomicrobia subdivision 3 bacterium]|nr:hypothetical protein [Limisphaerales bacterium]MCS1417334.1 hypothetical protein [Limisphaerales bacterium]
MIFDAGRVVALNLKDGKPIWLSGNTYHPGYATPVIFQSGADTILTSFGGKGFSLIHAASGREIAHYPFKTQYNMTATDPLVSEIGEYIFISAISQGELLRFDGTKLTSVWQSKRMRNSMNICALRDGHLFGIDGKHKSSRSRFTCIRFNDGEELWSKENYGYGTILTVDDILLVLSESGDLVAVEPSLEGYRELGRKSVLDSICWTPPSLSGKRVFLRNDMGRAVCLQLP